MQSFICRILGDRMSKFANTAPILKQQRKPGITQAAYAKKLKVHVQFVSNWERGKCLPPTPQMRKIYRDMPPVDQAIFRLGVRTDLEKSYMNKINRGLK